MTDFALVRYDAARTALKAARDVDEVKDIRDKSIALAEYARQAKDTTLIEYSTEIRVRAERRLGEMTAQIPTAQGRRTSPAAGEKSNGSPSKAEVLKSIGISTQQASRFEKLADISDEKFEEAVAAAKQTAREVTERAVLQATTPKRPADAPSVVTAKPDPKDVKIAALESEVSELREKNAAIAEEAELLQGKLDALSATEPDEQQKLVLELQLQITGLKAEIQRLRIERQGCLNKNNELIRQIRSLQKRAA